jgi:hypothetical protein
LRKCIEKAVQTQSRVSKLKSHTKEEDDTSIPIDIIFRR